MTNTLAEANFVKGDTPKDHLKGIISTASFGTSMGFTGVPVGLFSADVVITAAGLILLSKTMSLGMFYGAFALIAIGTSASSMTVLMTALANWVRRKLGIASGIAICGFGFSGLLVRVIVTLIEVYEWRMAVTILALGMLVVVLPLSLLFRHKPEQYGYFPDGQAQEAIRYDDALWSPAAGRK